MNFSASFITIMNLSLTSLQNGMLFINYFTPLNFFIPASTMSQTGLMTWLGVFEFEILFEPMFMIILGGSKLVFSVLCKYLLQSLVFAPGMILGYIFALRSVFIIFVAPRRSESPMISASKRF